MDDDPRRWLFDPPTAHRLVLARRPVPWSAVTGVVSDVVWTDVVRLLRWATADAGGRTELAAGRWWRLAAACADLHRRLPALVDEVDEPWQGDDPAAEAETLDGETRVARAAARLTALLLSDRPVPLQTVAAEIDALGAAAISAFAEQVPWTVPGAAS
ncbi:MAG TPA: hypothetical protein VE463_01970 [Blastococcus sp.]|jgi:hypothetical protein|nr:hypothetical protein [Blastococcus sp.]